MSVDTAVVKAQGRVLLPSTVVPLRYDIKLTPDLEAFTFDGSVEIDLSIADTDRKEIILHAKELCFISAKFGSLEAEEIRVNVKATTVTFLFPTVLESRGTLSIQYSGFINNKMAGFYRSFHNDIHGNPKVVASTQFESLDARRAFPCIDEPGQKSIFGVTLVVPSNLQCFSNMPTKRETSLPGGKLKEVAFLDSPKMSTYLVAFCVGEFDSVQAQTQHGVLVKVYTPPGKGATGEFALECAVKVLDLFDDFFGVPYPLPKLDMVAVSEFLMGAMENWGLVIFHDAALLVDPVKATSQRRQRVCTVVAHELSHQWFGNLVTMAWWDDLWLNEGFASWAEDWATDQIFPEWTMWDQFTTTRLSSALRLDALKSSHPIQVPIHHAEEVEQVFDAISYSKGGSVVKMIRAVIGAPAFQSGLQAYMKKHAYGNTETVDLWSAWESSSGMPIRELMASWTEQMGCPLLRVTKAEWNGDKVTLELDQVWFLSDGSELTPEESEKKWAIPIIICSAEGQQTDMILMRDKTATVTVSVNEASGWVKLNAGQEVPMRVLYKSEMIERLSHGVQSKSLSVRDRGGLVSDAYALVKAGYMRPESLIKLLAAYSNEDQLVVWDGLADALGGLDAVLSDDEKLSANFTAFAKHLVLQLAGKIGWESSETDEHLTTLLRAKMIKLLSDFCADDSSVAQKANTLFKAFLEGQSFPNDMQAAVFKIVLRNGGITEYNQVKSCFDTATDNAEERNVLNSLGFTPDPKLKLATLDWVTSGAVKLQDFHFALGSVSRSSKEGREISWTYFQDNFDKFQSLLQNAVAHLMDIVIVQSIGVFCSQEKADEILAFFKSHPLPRNGRKIFQTIENIRANANFLDKLQASDLSKDEFWKSL